MQTPAELKAALYTRVLCGQPQKVDDVENFLTVPGWGITHGELFTGNYSEAFIAFAAVGVNISILRFRFRCDSTSRCVIQVPRSFPESAHAWR